MAGRNMGIVRAWPGAGKDGKEMTQPGQKRNFQRELDRIIEGLQGERRIPRLLLHSCCAPCSSYVLEYLSQYFDITVYYYNPNIFPPAEYEARVKEQERLIQEMKLSRPVRFMAGSYERCRRCYELRLRQAADTARAGGYDYFTTTLSISPLKNAAWLNEIGNRLALEYGVPYLVSDFKKRSGYKRSVELSTLYGLYRQDYCGCVYSRAEAEKRRGQA